MTLNNSLSSSTLYLLSLSKLSILTELIGKRFFGSGLYQISFAAHNSLRSDPVFTTFHADTPDVERFVLILSSRCS